MSLLPESLGRIIVHAVENSIDSVLQLIEIAAARHAQQPNLEFSVRLLTQDDRFLVAFIDNGIGTQRSETTEQKQLASANGLKRKGGRGHALGHARDLIQTMHPNSAMQLLDRATLEAGVSGAILLISVPLTNSNFQLCGKEVRHSTIGRPNVRLWTPLREFGGKILVDNAGKLRPISKSPAIEISATCAGAYFTRHGQTFSNIGQLNPRRGGQSIDSNTITADGEHGIELATDILFREAMSKVKSAAQIIVVTSTQPRTVRSSQPFIARVENYFGQPPRIESSSLFDEIDLGELSNVKSRSEISIIPGARAFLRRFAVLQDSRAKLEDQQSAESFIDLMRRSLAGINFINKIVIDQKSALGTEDIFVFIFGHQLQMAASLVLLGARETRNAVTGDINWRQIGIQNSTPYRFDMRNRCLELVQ